MYGHPDKLYKYFCESSDNDLQTIIYEYEMYKSCNPIVKGTLFKLVDYCRIDIEQISHATKAELIRRNLHNYSKCKSEIKSTLSECIDNLNKNLVNTNEEYIKGFKDALAFIKNWDDTE